MASSTTAYNPATRTKFKLRAQQTKKICAKSAPTAPIPMLVSIHASAISAMVRSASRLGVERVAKDVGPTLGSMIKEDQEKQRQRLARERKGDVIDAEVQTS
jgi:hypothetical protein